MTITHVASQLATVTSYPVTINLPGGGQQIRTQYSRILAVPATIAVDDVAFIAGVMGSRAMTLLAGQGWSQLGVDTRTGQAVFWRRWATGVATTYELDTTSVSDPAAGITIWRTARGMRDVASVSVDYHTGAMSSGAQPFVAPGAVAGVGDVALLLAMYWPSDFLVQVGATTPATTLRIATAKRLYVASDLRADAGTTPAYVSDKTVPGYTALVATLCEPIAPLAPTLGAPAPSAVLDLASGATFTWAHNPAGFAGSASGAQEAYALRRRIGVGAYQYWTASTASWGSSIVWNASVDSAATFPAAAWTNETTYAWSVATQEDAGSVQGPFAPDRVVIARTKPVVAISAPSGVVTTPQPAIAWDGTFTSPWVAIAYQVRLFSQETADTAGFDPWTTAAFWESGQYASTAETVTPSIPLTNGGAYRVFVWVQQTGGQWSDPDSSDFTISLAAPAPPAIDARPDTDPDTGLPLVRVTVEARDNLLDADTASSEAGLGTWVAGANTALSRTTSWAIDGTHALVLTASALGGVAATTGAVPVRPDKPFTATVVTRAPAVVRDVTLTITWHGSTGLLIGSSPSAPTPDSTTVNTTLSVTDVAPSGAATAKVTVSGAGLGAGETLWVDCTGIAPGIATPWGPGGYDDITTTVEYTDDPINGPWGVLGTVELDGTATLVDVTCQPGQLRTYRARTSSGTYASAASEVGIAGIEIDDYWIVDTQTGAGVACMVTTDVDRTHPRDRGEFAALGRTVSQMVYGDRRATRGGFEARCWTAADASALVDLLNEGHQLLMQAPREGGVYQRHIYFDVTEDVGEARSMPDAADPERLVSWSWREATTPIGEAFGGFFPAVRVGWP